MQFHEDLKIKLDRFVHLVYKITRDFPKEELYGVTSQIRRAAISVVLNYIEGYARGGKKVYRNFLEISYGSLKEVKYLLHFSLVENYLSKDDYETVIKIADEIGAMLWGTISKIKEKAEIVSSLFF